MNEARRFIRYAIPGMVFIGVVVSLLCLVWWDVSWLNRIAGKDSGVGVVLASVLATGGLGIFFSAVYHRWHWRIAGTTMDHTGSIRRLVENGILELKDLDHSSLSRQGAWIITSAVWHQLLTTNERIKGAEPRIKDLLDLMHSLGTAAFAASAAGVVTLILAPADSSFHWHPWPIFRFVFAGIIAFAAFLVFHSNYRRTEQLARCFIDEVLSDALVEEQRKLPKNGAGGRAVVTWPLLKGADEGG